ncbi:Hsp70 family protein [Kordia sp.]|uniref:Hsp70 family protein n=1 Tax=Kordia sp. TaxID=1965332 RepID=UPI003D2BE793
MKNINIGIDLGTTNSAIAEYTNGKVTVHKNPVGFRELLPSVVSFRKNRTLIGDKAKERFLVDATNTFASFKRAMGSDKKYHAALLDTEVSPIDLSAMILGELKNFVMESEVKSAVVTIPASFNTIQSNATKEAGLAAGFEEVALLQEPIAACIAYSNVQELELEEAETWLVYDFGGGTFDASLAKVSDRSLEIIDHKGDNFLGGVDLDLLIIQKIICKAVENEFPEHADLWKTMISSEDINYKKLYYEFLFKAEEAKKELSIREKTFIEIENDELGLFTTIEFSREDFNTLVKPKFEVSYTLIEELLEENSLNFTDISRIIMVGGTTYIPYVRQELAKRTNIVLDTNMDPTQAVVIGAAYFAGNKESGLEVEEKPKEGVVRSKVDVQWIYENQSNDAEELLVALFDGKMEGYYRITRNDGGFDTGTVRFQNKITEFLPLISSAKNIFSIQLYNNYKELIDENNDIAISQGVYNVLGQPLPNDICIELDSQDGTYLEEIFKKNDILPLSKTIYKLASKTILKDSDDTLIINILEGSVRNSVASNLPIGYIEISGQDITLDIIKGLDIEINFKISESRDLSVNIFIDAINLRLKQVFNPNQYIVNFEKTILEIKQYTETIQNEIQDKKTTNFRLKHELKTLENDLINLYGKAIEYQHDTLTEQKYQINETKRLLIQKYDKLVTNRLLLKEIEKYTLQKEVVESEFDTMSEAQKQEYRKIIANEKEYLYAGNKQLIAKKTEDLEALRDKVFVNSDEYYYEFFYFFKHSSKLRSHIKKEQKFESDLVKGELAVASKNVHELKYILNELYANSESYFLMKNNGEKSSIDNAGRLGIK